MKRPLWGLIIVKKMWWFLKLPDRSPFFARVMNIVKRLSIIWNLIKLTPIKDDYVITLPRDKVLQVNRSIDLPEDIVLPSKIVEYFINKAKHHLIMNFCVCRYSNECKDHPIHYGCLMLGEAVLKVSPKLGRLVSTEDALKYIRKCQDSGLVHLIGKAYPDRIGLGATPHQKLMTICNCCPCCCGLGDFRHVPPQIAKTHHKMPGVGVKVTDECVGCGTCTKNVCFIDAIQVINKRAVIDEFCKGCGRCVLVCPQKAIKLTITDNQFIEKAINQISQRVDVS